MTDFGPMVDWIQDAIEGDGADDAGILEQLQQLAREYSSNKEEGSLALNDAVVTHFKRAWDNPYYTLDNDKQSDREGYYPGDWPSSNLGYYPGGSGQPQQGSGRQEGGRDFSTRYSGFESSGTQPHQYQDRSFSHLQEYDPEAERIAGGAYDSYDSDYSQRSQYYDPIDLLEGREDELIAQYTGRVPGQANIPDLDMRQIEELNTRHDQFLDQSERILGEANSQIVQTAANYQEPYVLAAMRTAGVSQREMNEVRDRVTEHQDSVDADTQIIMGELQSFGVDVRHGAVKNAISAAQEQFRREATMLDLRDAAKQETDRQQLSLDAWKNDKTAQEQQLRVAQGVANQGDVLTFEEIMGSA